MARPQGLNVVLRTNPAIDYPIDECRNTTRKFLADGAMIFQKWTCEKCGSREMQKTPDIFFPFGECQCGHVTDIAARGCNYMLVRTMEGGE